MLHRMAIASPKITEIVPGLLWVRLPLPLALNHVNAWLLSDGDGWTVVDTGFGNDASKAAWEEVERAAMDGRPVRRVICTHAHPDHIGLAGWFEERWGAPLWASQAEWLQARMVTLDRPESAAESWRRFHLRAGASAEALETIVRMSGGYRRSVAPIPVTYRRIRDGAELPIDGDRWSVVVGRGHSLEHVCLYSPGRRLLVSGDQVLPGISPNVSVWPNEPEAEPLGDFLATLKRLEQLPFDVRVLPSHGMPFSGLHRRIQELERHHQERLSHVLATCARPRTGYEVMRAMFERELDPHQTTFAVGESLAHLNHLVAAGLVRREQRDGEPDRYVRIVTA